MAKIERVETGVVCVTGEYDTIYVLTSLDEIDGALYQVINTNEYQYGVFGSLDEAVDCAVSHADSDDADHPDGEGDDYEVSGCDEWGDGMTDAEADADALAGIGWGTDEDYGYYGEEY